MIDVPYDIPTDSMFKPIVTAWTLKLEAASRARAPWQAVVDEIMMFYSKSAAAMFDPTYARKFWPGKVSPRFRVNINLAYEFVRVMMPELLWEIPHRNVEPKKAIEVPQELFQGQEELFQQVMMEQQMSQAQAKLAATLMQHWLNYTAREMPGGGLAKQSGMTALDALLKGRGVKVMRPFTFPGSGRQITGAFRIPPEQLLIDPDFKTMDQARWIAIQHVEPHYEVEKRFDLPEGMLRKKTSLESSWSNAESHGRYVPMAHQIEGKSNDLTVWYEIYSKCGVGTRGTELYDPVKKHLEESVGDAAYIAICPAVAWPLNAPMDKVLKGASTEEVRRMFEWPIPNFYSDDRWPAEMLDFYPNNDEKSESAIWPIPPLAPALGEIKMLNYLIPFLINRVWTSSRDFWGVAGPYKEQLQKEIEKGEDQAFIGMPAVVDDIRKVLTIIQQPETRRDVWELVGLVENLFRKRTGMVLTSYGMNEDGTQNRSAEETIAKHRAANSTPEFMQREVVEFEARCAQAEGAVARRFIRAPQVEGLVGPTLASMWDQVVASEDNDQIAAQLDYTIDAASIRRPNRERDIANFMQVMQQWLPIDAQYAGTTGDYSTINAAKKRWGELHDQDMDEMFIPDNREEQQQAQQQAQEMEQQKLQLEAQKLQLEEQKLQLEAAKMQAEMQGQQMGAQAQQMDMETKIMDAQLKQAAAQSQLELGAAQGAMELEAQRMEMAFDAQKAQQELELASGKGLVEILLGREKLRQAKAQPKAKSRR